MLKKILVIILIVVVLAGIFLSKRITQIRPSPTIEDSKTSIIGFSHIGLVVEDLDVMLDFYQRATDFELLSRELVSENAAANKLFGQEDVRFEKATLKSPNMFLELTAFDHQTDTLKEKMPPQGPGMTHTCYQSAQEFSGYDKFKKAGVELLSRGSEPIALGNYGVTYAYAHDPEGNMIEMEQMSNFVIWLMIGSKWAKENPMWMTQVGILSPNVSRLTDFYKEVFEIEPYRTGTYGDNIKMDEVANLDSLSFEAAWFMLDGKGKKLELMQYNHPVPTPNIIYERSPLELGYSYSLEVLDIQKEYKRLLTKGVRFISEPQRLGPFWICYAHDIDGNVFSLRQAIDPTYSQQNFL